MSTRRVTKEHLQAVVDRINRTAGTPMDMGHRTEDGRNVAHVGHYYIDDAYGGVQLCRICNESGGVTNVLRTGHISKRELVELMHAYCYGLEDGASPVPALVEALAATIPYIEDGETASDADRAALNQARAAIAAVKGGAK